VVVRLGRGHGDFGTGGVNNALTKHLAIAVGDASSSPSFPGRSNRDEPMMETA